MHPATIELTNLSDDATIGMLTPAGTVLTLAPGQTGSIDMQAAVNDAVQQAIADGRLTVQAAPRARLDALDMALVMAPGALGLMLLVAAYDDWHDGVVLAVIAVGWCLVLRRLWRATR